MVKREDAFNFGKTLGEGSFGAVLLTTDKADGKQYATKILDKQQILRLKKAGTVKRERDIMSMCKSPYIVRLFYTFQNPTSLFYVIELCPNRDLKFYLKKYGSFSEKVTQHYIAEIAMALKYLHSLNIIHRDLKPENVLLSDQMHVKITDFGTSCVQAPDAPKRKSSFVGTPEYVAPEIINGNVGFNKSVDFWSLGCMLFQFLSGEFPFRGKSDLLTFELINNCQLNFPAFMSAASKDLCEKLVVKDMNNRIGVNNIEDLTNHEFFKGIDFDNLLNITPPQFEAGSAVQKVEDFPFPHLLNEGEKVLLFRTVYEVRGLIRVKKDFIYTDAPRLFYLETGKEVVEGEIPVTKDLKYSIQSDSEFTLSLPDKELKLDDLRGEAQIWIDTFDSTKHKWK